MSKFVRQMIQGFIILFLLDVILLMTFDSYANLGMYKYLVLIIPYSVINVLVDRYLTKKELQV